MRVSTLILFLLGNRAAIERIVHSDRALGIGLVLVISAGFAREYDHESLIHEPWHLLIPLAASSALALLVSGIFWALRPQEGETRPAFPRAFRNVLTLFWMTAPLAWLYAIPYERFLEPDDATRVNLLTLGVVAAWRVILMSRVLAILTGIHVVKSFMLVMFIADVVALTALFFVPLPVINFMGGIQLSQSEQLISSMAFNIGLLGVLSLPVWIIGALVSGGLARARWIISHDSQAVMNERGWLMFTAIGACVIGLAALPFTQPAQMRRYQIERHLRAGQISEAIGLMSEVDRSQLPPLWDPPPRIAYGENQPRVEDVLKQIEIQGSAEWVRREYVEKLHRKVKVDMGPVFWRNPQWSQIDPDRWLEKDNPTLLQSLEFLLRMDDQLSLDDRVAIESICAHLSKSQ